jgi:hypothetical protein
MALKTAELSIVKSDNMETKDWIIIVLFILIIAQVFWIKFKNFEVELAERREKELLEDKKFWEEMYKKEVQEDGIDN